MMSCFKACCAKILEKKNYISMYIYIYINIQEIFILKLILPYLPVNVI